jgi:hypothetical protein
MITSHEETEDYEYFYKEFNKLCVSLGIDFKPKRFMLLKMLIVKSSH